jgi:hypothetical protein
MKLLYSNLFDCESKTRGMTGVFCWATYRFSHLNPMLLELLISHLKSSSSPFVHCPDCLPLDYPLFFM